MSVDSPGTEPRTQSVAATPDDAGQRLDAMLARHLTELSRSRISQLIDDGCISVDGHSCKRSYRLTGDEEIHVILPPEPDKTVFPVDMHIQRLYEDAHLAVIDKPAGVVVHPGHGTRAPTLVHGLLQMYGDLPVYDNPDKPGIVHRLDKDTSGCLVVARTREAQEGMMALFKARAVHKEYRAIVQGVPPRSEFTLNEDIGRHPRHRTRMTVHTRGGRRAVSHVTVVEVLSAVSSLLAVRIETGRTHQIRVHLAHVNLPVLGDTTYGKKAREVSRKAGARRQMLHACKISFTHPCTGVDVTVTSPLPADMREVCTHLRQASPAAGREEA